MRTVAERRHKLGELGHTEVATAAHVIELEDVLIVAGHRRGHLRATRGAGVSARHAANAWGRRHVYLHAVVLAT